VYKAKGDGLVTHQRLKGKVAQGGLLVVTPDPIIPFEEARFAQDQHFHLEEDASAVVVDICGSGIDSH